MKKKKKSAKPLKKNGKTHIYKDGRCIVCSSKEEDEEYFPESICNFIERTKR